MSPNQTDVDSVTNGACERVDIAPDATENQPLMRSSFSHAHEEPKGWGPRAIANRILPFGSIPASMFNLASATLGASIVALPQAFEGCGVILASVFLILCCAATIYSVHLLVVAYERTGYSSYEDLARNLLGKRMNIMVTACMLVFCWGTAAAYVITLGDLYEPFQKAGGTSLPAAFQGLWGSRLVVTMVWSVSMFPLSIPKDINTLRFASCFGVCAILYFLILMVVNSIQAGGLNHDHVKDLKIACVSYKALSGLSLCIFAYGCQPNTFEVYTELKNPSLKKMTSLTTWAMCICTVLYIVSGYFGYAEFGTKTRGAILENYDPTHDPAIAVAYACLVVKLVAAYSLCICPSRDTVLQLAKLDYHTAPRVTRLVVSVSLSVSSLLVGLFVPSLNIAFGLLGGLCGSMISMILPALYVMKSGGWSRQSVGTAHFIGTWTLLIGGLFAFVFGTAASIYETFSW